MMLHLQDKCSSKDSLKILIKNTAIKLCVCVYLLTLETLILKL